MIISGKVFVNLTAKNIKHYEELGYFIPREKDSRGRIRVKRGTKIEVSIEHLSRSSKNIVSCKCEVCGKIRKIRYDNLTQKSNRNFNKNGTTLCQSCANHEKFYKNIDEQYRAYVATSKYRKIKFNLTEEDFLSIVIQKCYYCGEFKDNKFKNRNGIDRLDSHKGYEINNCVPCCSTCNKLKMDLKYDDFLNQIEKIYKFKFIKELTNGNK